MSEFRRPLASVLEVLYFLQKRISTDSPLQHAGQAFDISSSAFAVLSSGERGFLLPSLRHSTKSTAFACRSVYCWKYGTNMLRRYYEQVQSHHCAKEARHDSFGVARS